LTAAGLELCAPNLIGGIFEKAVAAGLDATELCSGRLDVASDERITCLMGIVDALEERLCGARFS
jgi:hypothetical protein